MSDQLSNTLSLVLIIGSLAVILLATIPYVIGLPRSVRRRRRVRQLEQLEQLEQVRAAHQGQDLEIDWIDHKEIPKSEIRDVLGKHGWYFVDEHIGGRSWLLRFACSPPLTGSPTPESPAVRPFITRPDRVTTSDSSGPLSGSGECRPSGACRGPDGRRRGGLPADHLERRSEAGLMVSSIDVQR